MVWVWEREESGRTDLEQAGELAEVKEADWRPEEVVVW